MASDSPPFARIGPPSGVALLNEAARADNHGKRIAILIVAYNAVTTLTNVLKRISPEVRDNVEEITIFDDASEDSTFELAVGLKALGRIPKLEILKHRENLGYGGNQKAGYRYFIDKGFDIVVLLHGDGQYAPENLSHMYAPIVRREADAIFGSRMMKAYGGPLKGGMPLYKYVGNRILSTFENRALDMNLTEFHSGYRAYNLHALGKIDFSWMTNDFHFDTEIIIKLHHQGSIIREVPIPTYYGDEICRVNGMKYARDVYRAVRRYRKVIAGARSFPEFQEYFVHYPIKQSRYSSHYYARQMVGNQKEVLDVGCGEGFFAAELVKNSNRVTGVDSLPPSRAGSALAQYYSANLDHGLEDVIKAVHGKRFERILLLDVLEHLQNPARILADCQRLLFSDGQIIVSVPNIANFSVRLLLLAGRFDYTDRGILDRTHLRFFTRKTARALLQDAGYRIVEEKLTVVPIELVLGLTPDAWLCRVLNRCLYVVTRLLPGLFGYQIMMRAMLRTN